MSSCINFKNKESVSDFNSILSKLEGKEITYGQEHSDYIESLTDEQLNKYYTAYSIWQNNDGDMEIINEELDKKLSSSLLESSIDETLFGTNKEIPLFDKNVKLVYQGRNTRDKDSREFNYYTSNKNEAKDYGNVIEEKRIDTTGFLKKYELKNNSVEWTKEFNSLYNEFRKKYNKTFDILDNTVTGLETQKQFFSFIKEKGYKGYSEIIEDFNTDENNYIVTFSNTPNVSLSTKLSTALVKPGVVELFESNPELANAVYEAASIRNPGITVLPNGNLKIIAFRTEKVGPTSKGEYQRGKGLYLSLDKPYPGEDIYTVEIEISPKNLLDRKLGFGEISEDYFIDEKNKRVDKQLDTLHEFKQSLGIKAEIGSIDGALMNELVLFDKDLISKALASKQVYSPQQKQQAQQLYSQYLDTIFPESKVHEIVYHGVIGGKEHYNSILKTGFDFKSKRNWDSKNSKFTEDDNTGMFFSDLSTAQDYGFNEERIKDNDAKDFIIPAILNIKNLDTSKTTSSGSAAKFYRDNKNKSLIGMYGLEGGSEGEHFNYVVFEPEQIHILGSKQDIEGFKEFVNNKNNIKENNSASRPSFSISLNTIDVNQNEELVNYLSTSITNFQNLLSIYKNSPESAFKRKIQVANTQLSQITYADLYRFNNVKILHGLATNALFYKQVLDGDSKSGIVSLKEQLYQYGNVSFAEVLKDRERDLEFRQFMINVKAFIDMFSQSKNLANPFSNPTDQTEELINKKIEEIRGYSSEINDITNDFRYLLRSYYYNFLMKYTSNPNYTGTTESLESIARILEENDDISQVMYWLDTPYLSGVTFIDNVLRDYNRVVSRIDKEIKSKFSEFESIFKTTYPNFKNTIEGHKEVADWFKNTFLQKNSIGEVTRFLISKYKFNDFYVDKSAMFHKLRKIKDDIAKLQRDAILAETEEEKVRIMQEIRNLKNIRNGTINKWYNDNEKREMNDDILKEINEKQNTLSEATFNKWLKKENIYYDAYAKSWFKFKPGDMYINSEYRKLYDDNGNPIGVNGKFHQYMVKTFTELTEFNPNFLQPDGFLPVVPNIGRSNKESIMRFFGLKDEYVENNEYIGIGNELINMLSLDGLYHLGEHKLYTLPARKEKEEDMAYYDRVVNEVNNKYKTNFTTYDEVIVANNDFREKNEHDTVVRMDFDITNIMKVFIKNAVTYKYKKEYESNYHLLMWMGNNELQFNSRRKDGSLISNIKASLFRGEKETHKIKGSETLAVKRLKEFFDMNYYEKKFKTSDIEKVVKLMMRVSSMNLMWANISAGVVNVSKGYLDMLMESGAGEYLSHAELREATKTYLQNVPFDIMANKSTDISSTLDGALTKYFGNILTLKMETGITSSKDIKNMADRILVNTDAFYFANSSTEHFMQFSMLLGMMRSNRVTPDGRIVSYMEYTNLFDNATTRNEILSKVLTPEQINSFNSYAETINRANKRPNNKSDVIGDWIRKETMAGRLTEQQKKDIVEELSRFKKTAKQDFDKLPTLYSQFELVDGKAKFKPESNLTDDTISEFEEKVLAVNESFQGVYTQLGRSKLGYSVWGEMMLQYRKWMKPTWNRYFGVRFNKGIWNERTKSWQKGVYISAWDFITTPFKNNSLGITRKRPADITMIQAMSNLLSDYRNFAANAAFMWNTLDAYEQANVKRAFYNFMEIVGLALLIMLTNAVADDDKDKRVISSVMLYELSALYTDVAAFVPGPGWTGMIGRFWNNPSASTKYGTEMYKLGWELLKYPFIDDEDRYYKTGIKHGKLKVEELFKKNTPIVREYNKWNNMPSLVNFYHMYTPFWVDKDKKEENKN